MKKVIKLTPEERKEYYKKLVEIYNRRGGPYADRFANFALNWYEYGGKVPLWHDRYYATEWVDRFNDHWEYAVSGGICRQAIIDADGDNYVYFWRISLPAYHDKRDDEYVDKALKREMKLHDEAMKKIERESMAGRKSKPHHKKQNLASKLQSNFKKML